jgi:uncharacterized protein
VPGVTTSGLLAERRAATPPRRAALAGLLLAAVVAAVALLWAKWLPYSARAASVWRSGHWSGSSLLAVGGVHPGDAPTWHAAWSFTTVYAGAVWKALVAAVLISASVQAFVPRAWLLRVLNRRGRLRSALVGGALSTPSMMCTCCTAPVAATLRRDGVSTAAAVAYWLGNPLLNPAVLVFLALVAPWQWTLTRLLVGAVVVVGGAALVARLTERRTVPADDVAPAGPAPTEGGWLAGAPRRLGRALLGLVVVLVPEYLAVVLLVGAFRGWLFPLGGSLLSAGVLAALLATVVGTLLVLPTAGEIPVLQGLALAGLSAGGIGALLLTLPAVSLPGIAMVGRALGWRTTWATAGVVAAGGLLAGGLLAVLT